MTEDQIKSAILDEAQSNGGRNAMALVHRASGCRKARHNQVRKVLRGMLESGELKLAGNLNIVAA